MTHFITPYIRQRWTLDTKRLLGSTNSLCKQSQTHQQRDDEGLSRTDDSGTPTLCLMGHEPGMKLQLSHVMFIQLFRMTEKNTYHGRALLDSIVLIFNKNTFHIELKQCCRTSLPLHVSDCVNICIDFWNILLLFWSCNTIYSLLFTFFLLLYSLYYHHSFSFQILLWTSLESLQVC